MIDHFGFKLADKNLMKKKMRSGFGLGMLRLAETYLKWY